MRQKLRDAYIHTKEEGKIFLKEKHCQKNRMITKKNIYRTFLINSDLICQNLNQCLKNLTTYKRLNLNLKNIFFKANAFCKYKGTRINLNTQKKRAIN